jgi:phospholipid-binding lipoprotein MlaA
MRVKALSVLGKAAAVALSVALSACAASSPPLSSPDLVGSREMPANTPSTSAGTSLDAPTDAAALPQSDEAYDPYENMNRSVFEQNQWFYRSVLFPFAKTYNENVPEPVRNAIENFVTNLGEPMVFANDLLQLRMNAAVTTAERFAVNSTIGLAGISDVAGRNDRPHQSGDFGQTLYVWGVRKSPYLIVPVIGPTNIRDLLGNTVDIVATIPAGNLLQLPTKVASAANDLTVAGSVASPFTKLDEAEQMKDLEENSLDFYAMLRSVVEQKRQAELQEALQQSALTSDNYPSPDQTQGKASVVPFRQAPLATMPNSEFMANAFQGSQ